MPQTSQEPTMMQPTRYNRFEFIESDYEDHLHREDSKLLSIIIAYQHMHGVTTPLVKTTLLGVANEFERYLLFKSFGQDTSSFADAFHVAYGTFIDMLKSDE